MQAGYDRQLFEYIKQEMVKYVNHVIIKSTKVLMPRPLTGNVYIAIIKAVRVMSIFDLKGGMSGGACIT